MCRFSGLGFGRSDGAVKILIYGTFCPATFLQVLCNFSICLSHIIWYGQFFKDKVKVVSRFYGNKSRSCGESCVFGTKKQ